ncbi:MAG: hypothetical protein KatS3mg102_2391 [Planctomycetota bacterium]|nr:MAG: hypothetical protein KatS3mg102_2391 [Planctomycetota bacterium]
MKDTEQTRQRIEQRLRERLAPLALEVVDQSAAHAGHEGARHGGGHFRIEIVSAAFEGLPLLEQHRLVHEAVGYPMEGRIHALEIKTIPPSRWKSAPPPQPPGQGS